MEAKRTTRFSLIVALLSLAGSALADRHDQVINTASELRDWCKDESEATFVGRGQKPYNWSASYHDEGTVLVVKGQWRIDDALVSVECRVARGVRAEYATLSMQ